MQLVILRGSREMPWTKTRKELSKCFFGPTFIPDEVDPYKALKATETSFSFEQCGTQSNLPQTLEESRHVSRIMKRSKFMSITADNSQKLWGQVLKLIRQKKIQISTFVKHLIRQSAFSRKKTYSGYRKNDTNVLRVLAMELFSKRGSTKDFEFCLGIACKTGNVEEVINIIRNRLQLIGLGHNLVPSMRNVQRSTASLVNHFLALCKPQKSFSGFRTDLVACIQLVVFLLFKTENINNVKVDIWGDGCEIGGTEVTRMAFRLLSQDISAQSATSVFCFAGTLFSKIILKSFLHKFFSQLETKMIFFSLSRKRLKVCDGVELGTECCRMSRVRVVIPANKSVEKFGSKIDVQWR